MNGRVSLEYAVLVHESDQITSLGSHTLALFRNMYEYNYMYVGLYLLRSEVFSRWACLSSCSIRRCCNWKVRRKQKRRRREREERGGERTQSII